MRRYLLPVRSRLACHAVQGGCEKSCQVCLPEHGPSGRGPAVQGVQVGTVELSRSLDKADMICYACVVDKLPTAALLQTAPSWRTSHVAAGWTACFRIGDPQGRGCGDVGDDCVELRAGLPSTKSTGAEP